MATGRRIVEVGEIVVQVILEGASDGLVHRASSPAGRFRKQLGWLCVNRNLLAVPAAWMLANHAAAR